MGFTKTIKNIWSVEDLRKRIGSILYFTGDGIADKDIHNMSDAPYESVIAVIPYVIRYIKQSRERLKEIFS